MAEHDRVRRAVAARLELLLERRRRAREFVTAAPDWHVGSEFFTADRRVPIDDAASSYRAFFEVAPRLGPVARDLVPLLVPT